MARRFVSVAAREGVLVVAVGFFIALVLLGLGYFVTADTWLALVTGRIVADGGPPSTDVLTGWTSGRDWIDQQWLAQFVLYELWRAGGLTLLAIAHAVVVCTSLTAAVVLARRRGGSTAHTALACLLATGPILIVAGNIRTQTLAFPLFLATLWLVLREGRESSPRVVVAFPILVLWANVHGSVVIGAGLVSLVGSIGVLDLLRQGAQRPRARRLVRSLALTVLPIAAIAATPYGLETFSYLLDLFGNSEVGNVAPEWMPVTLDPVGVPFFVLAAGALWLPARCRGALNSLEITVLLLSLAGALLAVRNLAWFALTALVLLPPLLTSARSTTQPPRVNKPPSIVGPIIAVVCVVAAFAVGISGLEDRVDERFPPAAAVAVERALSADAALEPFIHPRYADWLLLRSPDLAGRLPFDIRYELLTEAELRRFRRVRDQAGADWRASSGNARLFMLDASERPLDVLPPTSDVLLGEPGARKLADVDDVVVILTPIRRP